MILEGSRTSETKFEGKYENLRRGIGERKSTIRAFSIRAKKLKENEDFSFKNFDKESGKKN